MDKPDHAEFWDSMYRSGRYLELWEAETGGPDFSALLAELALPAGADVLDLGCGSGREICLLASLGLRAHGIDLSPAAIELARRRAADANLPVDLQAGNVLELPYADSSFAFILDRGCLHLIPHGKWPQYAAAVARVLQIDGLLYLRACSDESNTAFHALSPALLAEIFPAAGLSVVSQTPAVPAEGIAGLPIVSVLLRRRNLLP